MFVPSERQSYAFWGFIQIQEAAFCDGFHPSHVGLLLQIIYSLIAR